MTGDQPHEAESPHPCLEIARPTETSNADGQQNLRVSHHWSYLAFCSDLDYGRFSQARLHNNPKFCSHKIAAAYVWGKRLAEVCCESKRTSCLPRGLSQAAAPLLLSRCEPQASAIHWGMRLDERLLLTKQEQ